MRVRRLSLVLALPLILSGAAGGAVAPSTPPTLTVEPRGGHYANDPPGLSVALDLRGEKSAPARISFHAPQAFDVEPERDGGTPVGRAEIYLRTADGGLRRYAGTISAAPATSAAAPCGAGDFAAAWLLRLEHGGKRLTLPMAVVSRESTEIVLCPRATQRIAAMCLFLDFVMPPAAPGSYRWSAVVTPRSSPKAGYELRSYVAVPHELSLRGAYRPATGHVVLTGTLRTQGRPRPNAEIDILQLDRTVYPLAFHDAWASIAVTTRRGAYRTVVPGGRTLGFVASTPPTLRRCTGPSIAPAGCRTATLAGAHSDPITVSVP